MQSLPSLMTTNYKLILCLSSGQYDETIRFSAKLKPFDLFLWTDLVLKILYYVETLNGNHIIKNTIEL